MYGQDEGKDTIQNESPIRSKARYRGTPSCPKNGSTTRGAELYILSRSVTTWLIAPSATTYSKPKCKRSAGQTNLISAQTLRLDHDNLEFGYQPTGVLLTCHIVTVKDLDTSSLMSCTAVVMPYLMGVKSKEDWPASGYDKKTGHSNDARQTHTVHQPPKQEASSRLLLTRTRIL